MAKKIKCGYCFYCNGEVNIELPGNHYLKRRDKSISFFHEDCFKAENEKNEEVLQWRRK